MSKQKGVIFVADYEYEAQNESELSYSVGDNIQIIHADGDWWYGEHTRTGQVGWVAPTYGHTRAEQSPYENLSDQAKLAKRNPVFQDLLEFESEFVGKLLIFMNTIILPLQVRDTNFKRTFMSEPAIGVSFSLLQEIYNACAGFESILKSSKNDADIATAYLQFAPSLQIFAQYASEETKFLNAVKIHSRQLGDFVSKSKFPDGHSLESYMIMPLEHYPLYKQNFQEFVWLSPSSTKTTSESLSAALDAIIAQSEYVDMKLKEEEESLMLLTLQSMFTGNPSIYTPTRKLLKEGEIERIKLGKNGEIVSKTYYSHLFNDAFIYSSKNVMGYFKFGHAIDFRGAKLAKSDLSGVVNAFSLTGKDSEGKADHFRLSNENDFNDWFTLIQKQISSAKTRRMDKRSSMVSKVSTALPGVAIKNLGARAAIIYRFLQNEIQFSEAVSLLNISLIQPLLDASKGAALTSSKVVMSQISNSIGDSTLNLKEATAGNKDALFEGSANQSVSKYQAQLITEALQAVDVQIFLRAAESISLALNEFVGSIEALCTKGAWNENIKIGQMFSSVNAIALFNQFKQYASGQQAALRILRTSPFAQFYKETEAYLSTSPGSLGDKIELPRSRVSYYLNFIRDLEKATPNTHEDHNALTSAISSIDNVVKETEELIRLKTNFEALLEIQQSLVSANLIGSDPIIQKLASMDRTFIKQGDLKKVCRKKNKTFRFWLFSDYILYGSSLGTGKFSLNRCIDLLTCTVAVHNSPSFKNALELFGAEKSFIIITPSAGQQTEWLEAINKAREVLLTKNGQVATAPATTAAIWVQDSGSDVCSVCEQKFTFFNRKHHCRKCGGLVCNEHSSHKEVIPHIHASNKQRICDHCFHGVIKVTTSSSTTSSPTKSSQHANATGSNKSNSSETVNKSSSKDIQTVTPVSSDTNNTQSVTSKADTISTSTTSKVSSAPVVTSTEQEDKTAPGKLSTPSAFTAQKTSTISTNDKATPGKLTAPTVFSNDKSHQAPIQSTIEKEKPVVSKLNLSQAYNPSTNNNVSPPRTRVTAHTPVTSRSVAPPPLPTEAPPPVVSHYETDKPKVSKLNMSIYNPSTTTDSSPPPLPKTPPPPVPSVPPPGDAISTQSNEKKTTIPSAAVSPNNEKKVTPPPPVISTIEKQITPPPPVGPPSEKKMVPPPPMAPPIDKQNNPPPPRVTTTSTSEPVSRQVPPPPATDQGDSTPKVRSPPPPPPPPSNNTQVRTPPPPPSAITTATRPNPPSAPEPAPVENDSLDPPVDDHFKKYRKMKEMLPEGAVRQKMTADGFAGNDIEEFLSGKVNWLPFPDASTNGNEVNISIPQLKPSAPRAELSPKAPSLLDAIKAGTSLKAVSKEDERMKKPAIQGAGGLLGMLANEMSKRRVHMKVDDEDDDSDSSGFSSDSDSGDD
eukprot:gene12646-16955_t